MNWRAALFFVTCGLAVAPAACGPNGGGGDTCVPSCGEAGYESECGGDGCGGSCGVCPDKYECRLSDYGPMICFSFELTCPELCLYGSESTEPYCGQVEVGLGDDSTCDCGGCPDGQECSPDNRCCTPDSATGICVYDKQWCSGYCEGGFYPPKCGTFAFNVPTVPPTGCDCGSCPGPQDKCIENECVCQPDCEGHECGGDGCGGACGECTGEAQCATLDSGEVVCCLPCELECSQRNMQCGVIQWDSPCHWTDPDSEAGCYCGPCGDGLVCAQYDCEIGDGLEPIGCSTQCVPASDACGTFLCDKGEVCNDGQCVACTPDCAGKECGDDGCGGSCGECDNGKVCQSGECVNCQPDCAGKECGDDGCSGSCGTCPSGKECNPLTGQCGEPCKPQCMTPPDFLWPMECGPNSCPPGCMDKGLSPCKHSTDCSVGTQCNALTGMCVACGSCGSCSGCECIVSDEEYAPSLVYTCCPCLPYCTGKECGPNGCGGSCGTCLEGQACNAWGTCE